MTEKQKLLDACNTLVDWLIKQPTSKEYVAILKMFLYLSKKIDEIP
jgi:hypothetical protein